jgi:sodium/hydrogen antiporter
MTEPGLIVILAFASYSLFNKVISTTLLTLPILFTGRGLALSGPFADALAPELIHEGKKVLAAVTLILVLFADASHVRFRKLAMNWQISARMLLVGMPLTLVLGKLIAYWLNPTPGLAMALLTAAVLPPTDAALGQSVVTSHQPERTQVK